MKRRTVNSARSPDMPFELKGSLFTLTVLQLWRTDLDAIERHLRSKIEQAPGFFQNVPVVLDVAELEDTPDFSALTGLLRRHSLLPVGVRNASVALQDAAVQAGLAILRADRSDIPRPAAPPAKDSAPKSTPAATDSAATSPPQSGAHNRLHLQPVRSGQQLYVPDGDLIVVGTISVGAEVLADGNIHVYGPLRGRALAGVRGNTQARIFCQSLEAQLVSVAGSYRVLDEPRDVDKNQPVQIYLEDERLVIEPLAR